MKTTTRKTGIDLKAALAARETTARQTEEITFGELCRAYLAAHYDGADMQLRKWQDAFGNRNAWQGLTTAELDDAGEAMIEAGYSPATVNRNLSQIGSVYRWAKRRRMTPPGFTSPTIGCIRHAEEAKPVELSQAEVDRLLAASFIPKDRRFAALVHLLVETGARRGEIIERMPEDFDFAARKIHVGHTKTGVKRNLTYSTTTAELIARCWPNPEPGRLLFESRRAPGKAVNFKKHWQEITASIGRPDLRMHDLRHFRAKQLLLAGVPVALASQALGHSSQIFLRRYAHAEDSATLAAIEQSWRAA